MLDSRLTATEAAGSGLLFLVVAASTYFLMRPAAPDTHGDTVFLLAPLRKRARGDADARDGAARDEPLRGLAAVRAAGSPADGPAEPTAPHTVQTAAPTAAPTVAPSAMRTAAPTEAPIAAHLAPLGAHPTAQPAAQSTTSPDAPPDAPTDAAPDAPTDAPPDAPTDAPPDAPSDAPPDAPSDSPPDAPPDTPPAAPPVAPLVASPAQPAGSPTRSFIFPSSISLREYSPPPSDGELDLCNTSVLSTASALSSRSVRSLSDGSLQLDNPHTTASAAATQAAAHGELVPQHARHRRANSQLKAYLRTRPKRA